MLSSSNWSDERKMLESYSSKITLRGMEKRLKKKPFFKHLAPAHSYIIHRGRPPSKFEARIFFQGEDHFCLRFWPKRPELVSKPRKIAVIGRYAGYRN